MSVIIADRYAWNHRTRKGTALNSQGQWYAPLYVRHFELDNFKNRLVMSWNQRVRTQCNAGRLCDFDPGIIVTGYCELEGMPESPGLFSCAATQLPVVPVLNTRDAPMS